MSSPDQDPRLTLLDRYWRAANYLSAGQIYLMSNPLLQEPLEAGHIKPRLLGHWGTTPGLNFIYAHLNRIITARDVSLLYICGPGHGGPGMVANTWLEGSYSEVYPDVPENAEGMQRLFKQFSFPGGVPSHAAPETPGSVNEGGELGYALSHAFGAAFDHPDLIVPCVIGDGEAETGALAASWPGIRFLNPARDGAVLPILHLNGYKIASPTLLGRCTNHELRQLFSGHGYYPVFVSGHHPAHMHRQMAEALDEAFDRISAIQQQARAGGEEEENPRWPMIILRSPKGWTGPAEVDGKKVEDFWRAHQVPVSACREDEGHRQILEQWLRSYRPEELFDAEGRLMPELRALAPVGDRRMGSSPYANGGGLRRPLKTANVTAYAQATGLPGATQEEPTACLGRYLSQVFRDNPANFRLFSPDETESNRLGAVFDVTGRRWMGEVKPFDEQLDREGRVMETLSEHQCQGWLEGYLLTGRHGLFSCYEAFIHIIGSMFNQHAKWLKVSRKLAWRKPVSSLNYLLSSHVWRQDNNGFSHQDPGFLDHVACKKPDIVRIYLPPDANTLLCVTDHCLNTWDRINVIVAGKHAAPQWLDIDSAIRHCEAGMGEWTWAGNTPEGSLPDVVMACAGDVPTLETLAAVDFLRTHLPALRVRVVNVVDLLALQPEDEHPHGKSGAEFEKLFTPDRPVIFAFHGYPGLIHRLASQRPHHRRLRVHGYREEGSTTTPFDMTVVNGLSRFHLAEAAVLSVEGLAARYPAVLGTLRERLEEHHRYVREQGEDLPAIRDWQWPQPQDDGRPVRAR